jgi:predicted molibdopterin-dependent oxidoreductase YjgC
MADVYNAPAILLIGNDPTEQHPLLAWQIRNNVRLHRARLVCDQLRADQAAAAGHELHFRFLREPKARSRAFLAGDDGCRCHQRRHE